jgi:hypothetical protein
MFRPSLYWILFLILSVGSGLQANDIRIGLIGLDTSHVIAFTRIFNEPDRADHVPGARVVAGWKGGSADFPPSATRVDRFTQQLQERFGIVIFDTIEELCGAVDAVMVTSVDGRPHLEQARPVIAAGLPIFIDKPMAASLADVLEIFRLAEAAGVPVFSASSFRFHPGVVELKEMDIGEIKGAISIGPAQIAPHHPDLFYYGIHPAEALFTILGTGCETVTRTFTADTDVVTGVWSGGRVGTLHGVRNAAAPARVILFGSRAVAERPAGGAYAEFARAAVDFFRTGIPPFPREETIELFAYMEAADESKRRGGVPVSIREILEAAGQ